MAANPIIYQTDSAGKIAVTDSRQIPTVNSISNISNSPTKLANKGNSVYDLIEFEADRLITGEIKPEEKDYSKYKEFEKNSLGATIIDKNKNVLSDKTIINLYASKPSNEKFNQVVDIEFTEFVTPVDSPLNFLESKLAALEATTAKSGSEKAALNRLIAQLRAEIASLKEQLLLAVDPGRNNIVSDTLVAGSELYSNQTGANGGQVKNMLLSRNRKAKGIVQENGAFKITTGTYDINGRPLGPEIVVWERGKDGQLDINGKLVIFKLGGNGNGLLETLRVNYAKAPVFVRTWGFGGSLSSKAKVQLTDSGILNLYDNDAVVWSSYGVTPAIDANPIQIDSRNAAGVGSSTGGTGQTGPVTVTPAAAATTVRVNWKLDLTSWNNLAGPDTFKIEVGDSSSSNFVTKFNATAITKVDAKKLDPNVSNSIVSGYFIVPANSTYRVTRIFSMGSPDKEYVELTSNAVVVESKTREPLTISQAIARSTSNPPTTDTITLGPIKLTGQAANAPEINITSLKTTKTGVLPTNSTGSGSGSGSGSSSGSTTGIASYNPSGGTTSGNTAPAVQLTAAQIAAARAAAASSGGGRR